MLTRYAGLSALYDRPQTKKSMVICSGMLLVRIVGTVDVGGSGMIDTRVRLSLLGCLRRGDDFAFSEFSGLFVVVSFGSSGCLGNGWRIMMYTVVRSCVQLVPASCTYVVQCNLR